ncbi:MAG TPA: hypothetical protein VFU32_03600 [Ktedonobacterales bacterium]|nr:hypothetical protein [Ktedonobacterales bacterium]
MMQATHLLLGIAAVALSIPIERRYKAARAARPASVVMVSG